jgi:anti-anti-sigma factor
VIENIHVSDHDGDVVVAELSGEIDFVNALAVGASLAEAMRPDVAGMVADLRGVTFMDSAGVRMLFSLVSTAETTRQRLGIVADETSPIWRLLKITNIHEIVPICGSVEECADGIGGGTGT